jgi:hypothetical protein
MDEDIRKYLKQVSRQKMYELWGRAKERDYEGLDDEAQRIVKIMVAHEDEFHNQFEFGDLTYDHEYDPDTEYDPFLHLTIHSIAETQLAQKEPVETLQFYHAIRKKKYSHHEAIHFIGQVISCMIFDVMKYKRPFNLDVYRKLLKKYKTRNPEKLMDSLEKDPLLSD